MPNPFLPNPYAVSSPVAVPNLNELQQQIAQLQAQMATLPMTGIYSTFRRMTLQDKINAKQALLLQYDPNAGITPPAAAAPILGQRIAPPKVGFDALKILLPTG